MATCAVCGNDYDGAMTIEKAGERHVSCRMTDNPLARAARECQGRA